MLQNKQRVHHRQGKQALGDTTEGQGYQAFHRRGAGQETAVEAVGYGRLNLCTFYRSSSDSEIKLSVNPTGVSFISVLPFLNFGVSHIKIEPVCGGGLLPVINYFLHYTKF